MNIENLKFHKFTKIVYEIVDAAEIEEDIEIQTNPDFKNSNTKFIKGDYIVKYRDGRVTFFNKDIFNKYFKKAQTI